MSIFKKGTMKEVKVVCVTTHKYKQTWTWWSSKIPDY